MTPRQLWFKARIEECLNELSSMNKENNLFEFKNKVHELACELLYATTEWDKYYREINFKEENYEIQTRKRTEIKRMANS